MFAFPFRLQFSSLLHAFPLFFTPFSFGFSCFRAAALAYPPRVNLCKRRRRLDACDERERAGEWSLLLCCKQLQHVSPSLFHTPVPAPSPSVFVLARLSICKWCISGEKMLLMIYLHLALIYANVSLSPIVWLPACLPPLLLSLPFSAAFLWEFVISVRVSFFQFFMHARKLLWHF